MNHEGRKGRNAMKFAFCPSPFVSLVTFVVKGFDR